MEQHSDNCCPNNVSSVSGRPFKELKTTLARFKALIEMEKKIETTLTNYKLTYAVTSIIRWEVAQKLLKKMLSLVQILIRRQQFEVLIMEQRSR